MGRVLFVSLKGWEVITGGIVFSVVTIAGEQWMSVRGRVGPSVEEQGCLPWLGC